MKEYKFLATPSPSHVNGKLRQFRITIPIQVGEELFKDGIRKVEVKVKVL